MDVERLERFVHMKKVTNPSTFSYKLYIQEIPLLNLIIVSAIPFKVRHLHTVQSFLHTQERLCIHLCTAYVKFDVQSSPQHDRGPNPNGSMAKG